MAGNIRTYICTGCGIDECLNNQQLADVSSKEMGVPAQVHPPLCLPEGVDFLRKDIEKEGADKVVIAACSSRVNWDVFSVDSLQVKSVERVNIREQVVWSHPANHPETQSMAQDYLRMGIVRAQKATTPTPYTEANERSILVVGGGAAGLAAADGLLEFGREFTPSALS